MKKKIYIILIILVVVILIFLSILFLFNNKNKNMDAKTNYNTQVIDGISFSNVSIDIKDDKKVFKVKINTKNNSNVESFDAILKDKNNKIIETLSGYIGGISSNEDKIVEIPTTKDITKTTSITYKLYY